ncbi:Fanconi anemia group M protein isoform X2 [Polyodon spathula]|uniref:Fanconi anemia group M protein isoform X2 n=1 Tax=Polyodon spathula TaxID=7913 RepID=UPI001B7DCD79|nr:Fanconi anemia group M protein isoform X2 [Polyodon spathula]
MSAGKQRTLFQTWGTRVPQNQGHSAPPTTGNDVHAKRKASSSDSGAKNKNNSNNNALKTKPAPALLCRNPLWGEIGSRTAGDTVTAAGTDGGFEDDSDDDLMLVAVYEAEKSLDASGTGDLRTGKPPPEAAALPQKTGNAPIAIENLPGFDISSADVWIYPTNYPVRDYQFSISQAALFQNTLVCLPTGLGKTFIAAVVMYNFYRWYPSGKIVFLAPTKPLVAQQIEACYKVMGIPQEHMAEMTGSTQALSRRELWSQRRVFFLTPQVMVNDLSREACPAVQIKCVVFDEAHKALGNHAYCQVVRELGNHTRQFRVLALSATPGSDARAVQQVISNLLVSHIELRSEECPDIQAYSHQRSVEKFVVPLGEGLKAHQNKYLQVLEVFAGRLVRLNVLPRRDIHNLTKYQLVLAREQFRNNPHPHIAVAQKGTVEGDFALCISLYHGYELLLQMGIRSLFLFMQGIMDGTKGMTRARNELSRNPDFMGLYQQMEAMFVDSSGASATRADRPFVYSHPKLRKLEEVVVEHFQCWSLREGQPCPGGVTRVMIFSSFRESVQEIAEMLSRHQPLIQVMTFMGQSSAGKGVRGFTQKEQLEVVKRFREGGYNTLVSTCVGEEGLDIGELDLIVCFDAQKSPIRLVQRMGRTGRKRQGRIVVILAEGREERTYNQSQSNKRSIYKTILGKSNSFHMYQSSPRMLPEGVNPAAHKMYIATGEFEHKSKSKRYSTVRRSGSGLRESFLQPRTPAAHQGNSKGDGLLSPEEFQVWSAVYRLRDEPQPRLPREPFASVQEPDLRDTESQAGPGVRELSLSEWRLWQNRLFPTELVDHSERCKHFSGIMETVERMRQEEEEGDCSYASALMPYLHMEDVVGSTVGAKDGSVRAEDLQDQTDPKGPKSIGAHRKAVSSKQKLPLGPSARPKEADKNLLEFQGSSSKRGISRVNSGSSDTRGVNAETPFPGEDHAIKDRSKESTNQSKLAKLFKTKTAPILVMNVDCDFDTECAVINKNLDQVVKTAAADETNSAPAHIGLVRDSLETEEATERSVKFNQKASSDTGYSSLVDATQLDLDSVFYLPELNGPLESCGVKDVPDNVKDVLESVRNFLTKSPPRTLDIDFPPEESHADPEIQSELNPFHLNFSLVDVLENDCEEEDSIVVNDVENELLDADKAEDWKAPMLDGSLAQDSISKAGSPSWDDVFDECNVHEEALDNGGQDPKTFENCETLHQPQTIELECGTSLILDEEDQPSHARSRVPAGHDDSINLFEDDDLFLEVSIPCPALDTSKQFTAGPELQPDAMKKNLLLHQDDASHGEAQCGPEVPGTHREAPHVDQHKSPEDEGMFDCSGELFSVNFDMGFSLEDSGGDVSDNGNGTVKPEDTSETPAVDRASEVVLSDVTSFLAAASSRSLIDPFGRNSSTPLVHQTKRVVAGDLITQTASPFSPLSMKKHPTPAVFSTPPTSFSSPGVQGQWAGGSRKLQTEESLLGSRIWTPKSFSAKKNPASIKRVLLRPEDSDERPSCDLKKSKRVDNSSESEEEVVFRRRGKRTKPSVLRSPENKNTSDLDSPFQVTRTCQDQLSTFEESENEGQPGLQLSDEDFQDTSVRSSKQARLLKNRNVGKGWRKPAGRLFLDEEAELSEGAEGVSSDEDSEEEHDNSLEGFVVGHSQLSQGLNDSDMHGVYLKSVRSPIVYNKYKMVYKQNLDDMAVFSQIPEQDETYMDDSFVVHEGEDEEEGGGSGLSDEDEVGGVELLQEDSYVGGRKQYRTRRHERLKQARVLEPADQPAPHPPKGKKKASRIIVQEDSSEEEEKRKMNPLPEPPPRTDRLDTNFKTPRPVSSSSLRTVRKSGQGKTLEERCQLRLRLEASLSEALDFQPPSGEGRSASTGKEPQSKAPLQKTESSFLNPDPSSTVRSSGSPAPCVLVDSREIASGPEVISCLRVKHGLRAEVCSLGGCDFIVSNRMAVERRAQSEISHSQNRGKLVERVQSLRAAFERVCLIVEKDRTKGETSRIIQRTRYYDSTLSALLGAGTRILFSSGQEETAGLLAELAHVEQRKNAAITAPLQVKGHQQQALQFYLTIPGVSYVSALNMCHRFRSVWHMVNSSVDGLALGACVDPQRAEEIFRYLHYSFDAQLLPDRPAPGSSKRSL